MGTFIAFVFRRLKIKIFSLSYLNFLLSSMLVILIWPLTLTSEASQDDDENTFESDKFDFEKAIASKDGNQEEGFDENHELPDLPEDLRELINLDDLKKVIQMEVDEEPEVDYELQKVLGQTLKA